MAETALLSVQRVAPLDDKARQLLDEASRQAHVMWANYLALPPEIMGKTLGHVEFILRRWVLELILLIRQQGAVHYGDISRQLGGLPSGSLSPKLKGLVAAGVLSVERRGIKRVYGITQAAQPLADGIYALATAKAYHHAHVSSGGDSPDVGSFTGIAPVLAEPVTRQTLATALDDYATAIQAFSTHHTQGPVQTDLETPLETARRFTAACGRKWHGVVMTQVWRGPQTFTQLREATGMGDQALTNTLKDLMELRAVKREDDSYSLAPFGLFDMAFGTAMVALYERLAKQIAA